MIALLLLGTMENAIAAPVNAAERKHILLMLLIIMILLRGEGRRILSQRYCAMELRYRANGAHLLCTDFSAATVILIHVEAGFKYSYVPRYLLTYVHKK
jgi:hypothetical protein